MHPCFIHYKVINRKTQRLEYMLRTHRFAKCTKHAPRPVQRGLPFQMRLSFNVTSHKPLALSSYLLSSRRRSSKPTFLSPVSPANPSSSSLNRPYPGECCPSLIAGGPAYGSLHRGLLTLGQYRR